MQSTDFLYLVVKYIKIMAHEVNFFLYKFKWS
uniref:Uncharacterized protein n=1 Tax=Anguilla anguilla TaxID=7936 RepID=A0A0E9UTT0_ANGAN